MSKTVIRNEYVMTPEELVASRAVAWRARSHRFIYKFMKIVATFYVLLTLWQVMEGWQSPVWLVAAGVFALLAWTIQRWDAWIGRLSSRRHSGMSETYAFVLSEDGVHLDAGDRISGALDWDHFQKLVFDPEGALIYFDKMRFFWLPSHGYADDQERARAHELLRRHIDDVHGSD